MIDWSLQEKQWKPIKGFENYEVSNYGEVVNTNTGNFLRQGKYGYGRPAVSLSKDGKQKYSYVYRLVAAAFIPNPNNYPEVNHINGNPWDNYVENLEWCTHSQNALHCNYFELTANGHAPEDELIDFPMPYCMIKKLYTIMQREHKTISEVCREAMDEYIENHSL